MESEQRPQGADSGAAAPPDIDAINEGDIAERDRALQQAGVAPPGGNDTPLATQQRFRVDVATVFADDGEAPVTPENADRAPATYRLVPVSQYGRQPVSGDVLMTAILPSRDGGVSEDAMQAAIGTSSTWAERTEEEKQRYRHRLAVLLEAVEPVIRREALADAGIARVSLDSTTEVIDSGQTTGLHIGLPLGSVRKLLDWVEHEAEEEGYEIAETTIAPEVEEMRKFVTAAEVEAANGDKPAEGEGQTS